MSRTGRPPQITWPANLDWTQSDAVIARKLGCGRWWVWAKRKQLGKQKPTQRKPYERTK